MKQAEPEQEETTSAEVISDEIANTTQHLQSERSWPAQVVLKLIWCYQHYISSWTPPSCRFYPTCSHYTYQAIERFGFWHGLWLGLCRLGRCHPFRKGGFDPVPTQWPFDKKFDGESAATRNFDSQKRSQS